MRVFSSIVTSRGFQFPIAMNVKVRSLSCSGYIVVDSTRGKAKNFIRATVAESDESVAQTFAQCTARHEV
jgi:hypothetical protein